MNFSIPRDIPGNLAGDLGMDQTSCPAGARPSPFNDSRTASGTVELIRASDSTIVATPSIAYRVQDTIDLCPGDCGTSLERVTTVPLSQFEATGVSGDVPFTVELPCAVDGSLHHLRVTSDVHTSSTETSRATRCASQQARCRAEEVKTRRQAVLVTLSPRPTRKEIRRADFRTETRAKSAEWIRKV